MEKYASVERVRLFEEVGEAVVECESAAVSPLRYMCGKNGSNVNTDIGSGKADPESEYGTGGV